MSAVVSLKVLPRTAAAYRSTVHYLSALLDTNAAFPRKLVTHYIHRREILDSEERVMHMKRTAAHQQLLRSLIISVKLSTK